MSNINIVHCINRGVKMHYNELLIKLSYLTQRNNIKQTEIGKCINKDRSAMNKRAKYNFKFTDVEIKQIENYFNVSLSDIVLYENSKNRQYDENIKSKHENIGKRIQEIINQNKLTNTQMAGVICISEQQLSDLINGKSLPDLIILDSLKQNFKISIDWLLYGV